MKKVTNQEFIEGRLYQHNLEIKKVQNKESKNYGTDFISGTLDVATDEEGLNIVTVHYTYVVETTSSGKKNVTFETLKNIIEGGKAWITDGKDEALKLRLTPSLALNDFYTADNQLVSAKRNEGGFVNVVRELSPVDQRNRFKCDMVITGVTRVEGEDGAKDFLRIRGAVFNFRNDLLPVEFVCRREDAFSYFEGLNASSKEPVFTEVRGAIVSNTIKLNIEEESAFGSASVRTVTRNVKEYVIDWARPTEYDFGAEDVLTVDELKKAQQNREVYLAEIKKRTEDFRSNRNSNSNPGVPAGGFDF